MLLGARHWIAAFVFAVVVNGAGVALLVTLNARAIPRPAELEPRARRLAFVTPPKPKSKPKPAVARSSPSPKLAPLPVVPNIPARLAAPRLGLPELAIGALITPQFDRSGGHLGRRATRLILSEEQVDTPPRPIRRVPPSYPLEAEEREISGWVELRLLISPQGRVERVMVLRAEPSGFFERAATQALKRWRFSPGRYRGKDVAVWVKQRLNFSLD